MGKGRSWGWGGKDCALIKESGEGWAAGSDSLRGLEGQEAGVKQVGVR